MTDETAVAAGSAEPRVAIWKVRELLGKAQIRIPDYQRPYTWTSHSVAELVEDIRAFTAIGDYRIGTVILHRHLVDGREVLDVVDGQQRLTTLHLLARALRANDPDAGDRELAQFTVSPFGTDQTRRRVSENFEFLGLTIAEWPAEDARSFEDALFARCEVVVVVLTELDEAFQMFDSQNSRGRALYPTDLLKAFHLREIGSGEREAALKRDVVAQWEEIPAAHVNALFSEYLFRIRRWASGRSVPREGFEVDNIAMFKGIRESDAANGQNNWARPFVYAKNFIDDFRLENETLLRFGMLEGVRYPHQIDQPVLNGETFFRMVSHYYKLGLKLGLRAFEGESVLTEQKKHLAASRPNAVKVLDERSTSSGDRSRYAYVRGLMDALLLYYVDRFGTQELERFASLAARYVMIPRATMYAVKRETIDAYALGENRRGETGLNLFREVREANTAREVLGLQIPRPELWGNDPERGRPGDLKVVDALWTREAQHG